MKKITLLLITTLNISMFAQDKPNDDATTFNKVQIGINFSPDIAYRAVKNVNTTYISNLLFANAANTETAKFGYTGGFNLCYNIKRYFGLEIGVQFSNKGYQTKTQNLIWPQTTVNQPTKYRDILNFYYLDIPVKANFSFGKKKLCFFSSIGLTTSVFLTEGSTSILTYADGKTTHNTQAGGSNSYMTKVGLSPTISLGINYKINSKTSLRIEPTFRYGVIKADNTTSNGINYYLWTCGLNIGYYFGL